MPGRKRKQVDDGDSSKVQDSKEPAKMTVAELRKDLQERGLETSGRKAELVSRLEEALKGADEADTESPDEPPKAKKAKTESATDVDKKTANKGAEEGPTSEYGKAVAQLKEGEKKKRTPKVDQMVPGAHGYTVVDDWDCMLNQTNIGDNNNKYYVIQMLLGAFNAYYVWSRWGRVGESGQNAMKGPFRGVDDAAKEFKKKFSDKTKNKWENRDQFTPVPGKYTLLEMDDEDDDADGGDVVEGDEPDAPPKKVKACTLNKPTQDLVSIIFDNDMFNNAMQKLELDTKKMPLGKLSKSQIAKGFEVLEELEQVFAKKPVNKLKLQELSSRFYTIIPHDFGRRTPPVIGDEETLRKKFDMLLVLGDIEIAQTMQKEQASQGQELEEVPHPLDVNYELLQARLTSVSPSDNNHKLIQNYIEATTCEGWSLPKLIALWEVDRQGEGTRFSKHDYLVNRRLLWHGTNVAVVAAILKGGLRIMPHSGGRVGKGIYFASEYSKSAGYVRGTSDNIGVMFLGEVALGREKHISTGNSSLTKPPDGYDSIVARGRTEPDPKEDTAITLDGNEVTVPQGKPISMPTYNNSSFSQSEYLIYKESQCRLRYLCLMKF